MIWKTIKAVIWDATTPFYISMDDGSVYEIRDVKDPYEDRTRIEYKKVEDVSNLDIDYQLDLWIIDDDQYDKLNKEQGEKCFREANEREDERKRFKNLVDQLEAIEGSDAMQLLRAHKHLL